MWDHYRHLHFNSFSMTWRRLKARCFDPCNRTLKFWETQRTPKSPFGECECHPHTLPKVGLWQLNYLWNIIDLVVKKLLLENFYPLPLYLEGLHVPLPLCLLYLHPYHFIWTIYNQYFHLTNSCSTCKIIRTIAKMHVLFVHKCLILGISTWHYMTN